MKTFVTSHSVKLSVSVHLWGVVLLLLTGYTAQAQSGKNEQLALHTQSPSATAFGAAIFPSLDPLKLKVLVRNPRHESLSFLIRNARQEVIYRKELGRPEILHTNFYLSNIPNGEYTIEVKAESARYTKSVRFDTNAVRVAQVQ